MRIYPVIMCGGAGTRLWPLSRPSRPKQFVQLIDGQTLFQQTIARVRGIDGFARLIVVAGVSHGSAIASQMDSDLDPVILLEPEGRNSAPAIAAAALWIAENDPDAIAVIVAADHFIPDQDHFCATIAKAASAASHGKIVTMGIKPTMPTSAYGYIRPAKQKTGGADIPAIDAFVEKPDLETAQKYIAQGYLWNSGNFIFRAGVMVSELKKHAPDVLQAVQIALKSADNSGIGYRLGAEFCKAPKISIDYAVMEKTTAASVIPVDLVWSDLGAWDAVARVSPANSDANTLIGDCVSIDSRNCYVRTTGNQLVATVGVNNLAVIVDSDAVLVCDLDASQSVRHVVDALHKEQKPQVDIPAAIEFCDIATMAAYYRQWLFTAALPLWWSMGADHEGWGFHDYLTVAGEPLKGDRRARVQARQTYVYAIAGKLGWAGPWRDGVRHGFAGLDNHYVRDDGLLRMLVSNDGVILKDTALLYDQAFALLVLSAAQSVIEGCEARAVAILERIKGQYRHDQGGFRENSDHPYAANPHMHLFEAALAWRDVSDNPGWSDLADEIAGLAMAKFIDPDQGYLREFFDANWQPAKAAAGAIVEPGHQFEWAWLFTRWAGKSHQSNASQVAQALYDGGRRSIDYARNVAVNRLGEGLKPVTMEARLWPQAERLKAALALMARADGDARLIYEREALSAGASLWRYLDMDTKGLWRDTMLPDASFIEEPVTASTLYHLITTIDQMLAITVN